MYFGHWIWVRMYLGLPICFLDKPWSTSKGFWKNPTWCCKNDKFMIEVPQLQIGTFCALKPWDLFKFSIMFLKFFKMTYCTDKFKFYRYLWGPVIYSHITIQYSKNILKFLNIKKTYINNNVLCHIVGCLYWNYTRYDI